MKLNSSNGLLFYVAGERGTFMALFVSNGRFVFLVGIGRHRLRIRSKDKYRDRRWHTVSAGAGLARASLSRISPLPAPDASSGARSVQPHSAHLKCARNMHGHTNNGDSKITARAVSLPCPQLWH